MVNIIALHIGCIELVQPAKWLLSEVLKASRKSVSQQKPNQRIKESNNHFKENIIEHKNILPAGVSIWLDDATTLCDCCFYIWPADGPLTLPHDAQCLQESSVALPHPLPFSASL